nr:MAG: replication initiator protein [Microvirus sp.]
MTCYTPLVAYRTYCSDSRTYNITFNKDSSDVIGRVKLPCGKCIGCHLDRSRMWAIRCVHEAQLHDKNCFITLTFSDSNLSSNASLVKSDFQNFMKRLRKMFPKKKYGKIGYYHCGEYGDKYARPHHHACLFNFDFPDKVFFKKTSNGDKLYTSELLQDLWQHKGHCLIGDVTIESAAYVARYCTKKVKGDFGNKVYKERLNEYSSCSTKPAIGLEWIKKFCSDVYPHDKCVIDGKLLSVPRYYDKFIEKHFNDLFCDVKISREKNLDLLTGDNSLSRLNTRHQVQLLRQKTIVRNFEKIEDDLYNENLRFKDYDQRCVDHNNLLIEKEMFYEDESF